MAGFFAYQDFTTCSLESRDISLFSSCVADLGVKVIKGEKWGGVENPDTSLVRRLKHSCQYRNTKSRKRRDPKTKTNKTESDQNKPKTKGGREEVLKNLTRLWPGSSSTLTGDKWNRKSPNTQEIKVRQHNRGGAQGSEGAK